MSRGINKVILIGNLGDDPEVRVTDTTTFANLSIATDESYKDKTTGQMVPKTEWHRVVFAGKVAEICQTYLKKGSKVYIEGKLQTRKWQDQSGADRYTTEIRGFEMQMLDSKGDGNQQQAAPQQQAPQQTPQQVPQGGYQQQAPQQAPQQNCDQNGQPLNPQQMQQQAPQRGYQPQQNFNQQG